LESNACRLVQGAKAEDEVTDGFKIELLDTLCLDNYLLCSQADQVLQSIDYAETRVTALMRMFSRLVNPEELSSLKNITNVQQEQLQVRLPARALPGLWQHFFTHSLHWSAVKRLAITLALRLV
jgi:hypothetical protein